MIRKLLFAAIGLSCSALMFQSCDKIAKSLAKPQDIPWTGIDDTIIVPPVSDTNLHGDMGTGSFTFDFDGFIKSKTDNLLGMKNIDNFTITSCTLTILNPDASNNFANFELAEAVFLTNINTTGANIGEIDNNPDSYTNFLSLPVNNTVNLRSYLPNSGTVTVSYVYGGKLRRPTTVPLSVAVHVEYNIHVTPNP